LDDLRKRLSISPHRVEEINEFLTKQGNPIVESLIEIVDKHGGIKEINRRAEESGSLDSLMERLEKSNPAFLKDLYWLQDQRDDGVFIGLDEYRRSVLGDWVSYYLAMLYGSDPTPVKSIDYLKKRLSEA